MTRANPRIEIYFREKGKKRWLKTGRIYSFNRMEEAQAKMAELFRINKGRKQYLLKPYKYK